MSSQNCLASKRLRRAARQARKQAAAKRIPHCGVRVQPRVVRQHRYLQQRQLPHVPEVAAANLDRDPQTVDLEKFADDIDSMVKGS